MLLLTSPLGGAWGTGDRRVTEGRGRASASKGDVRTMVALWDEDPAPPWLSGAAGGPTVPGRACFACGVDLADEPSEAAGEMPRAISPPGMESEARLRSQFRVGPVWHSTLSALPSPGLDALDAL